MRSISFFWPRKARRMKQVVKSEPNTQAYTGDRQRLSLSVASFPFSFWGIIEQIFQRHTFKTPESFDKKSRF